MNEKRMTKLYENLTNPERARLAFHYQAHGNEEEVGRIAATAPRELLKMPAAGFMDRFDNLCWMAMLWSVNHWIAQHRISAATAAALAGLARKDNDLVDLMTARVRDWEGSIVALDAALDAVCEANNIDPADVRQLTDTEPYVLTRTNVKPDPGIFDLRKRQLESAISA